MTHAGWNTQGQKYKTKLQILISYDFNNKKRVHFVGIIIVQLSTCTERQQLKLVYMFHHTIRIILYYVLFSICHFIRLVRKTAKSDYQLRHFCPSVSPHGTTRLPLDGFSWNLIFEDFSKICRENSSFIKICQEWRALNTKTNIRFLSYLAHFVLEWEMFQTKGAEKIKTHILRSVTFFFFRKSFGLWENVENCMLGM
jgi:hypothetical protein